MNNPIMYADPSGHSIILAMLIGAGIGLVVGLGSQLASDVISNVITNGFDFSEWEMSSWQTYVGAGLGGAIGGLGVGVGSTILAGGVGNVIEAAFAGEISSFGDVMVQFALGGVLGGVGYGISKGITSIFADRKIFSVLGNLTDNTKVNKRLVKAGFGHLKIGKHGLHNVYKEMYEAYGFNTMKDAISSVYDFAVGLAF